MPKGEKVLAQSKRTAPPPLFLKEFFKLVSYCVQKGEKVAPSKIDILKPSWTLKEEFIEGEFCLSQRKSIWNRGRKFQILKMLLKILFIYLWLFSKRLWKRISKRVCKNKTSGASVVQNVKIKESNPCISNENIN